MSNEDVPLDEDTPITSLSAQQPSQDDAEDDISADFRFLASLNPNSKLPKRGDKDFEPHGTNAQSNTLEASREAMHEALSYTRVHNHGKKGSDVRGWYFGDGVEGREECFKEEVRGRVGTAKGGDWAEDGLNWVVMVEVARGPMFKSMGRAPKGLKNSHQLWLLPEEALYLVERGDLDLYWPGRPLDVARGILPDIDEEENDEDADMPLSLQAAWALLAGSPGEVGRIDLDAYTVYANLKRTGYGVLRVPSHDQPPVDLPADSSPFSIFNWLFGSYFNASESSSSSNGPLVVPGLYRSYTKMYHRLNNISRHEPTPTPPARAPPSPTSPFQPLFGVYKTNRIATLSKTAPGPPDFRIAVVPAQASFIPTLEEMTGLLEATPWDPPNEALIKGGDAKSYGRLKHGFRNVVMAIVDRGVVSYLRISEAAFGEESLVARFDRGSNRGGGKRGGFRGRGRGKGKGR